MEITTLLWVLGGVAGMGLTAGWLLLRGRTSEEAIAHCRCSSCGQKMRYRASRSGQKARCPRCGHSEVLSDSGDEPSTKTFVVGRRLHSATTHSSRS
jgi:hypothetical protein